MEIQPNESLPPLPESKSLLPLENSSARGEATSSVSKKRKFRLLKSYLDSATISVTKETLEPINRGPVYLSGEESRTPPPNVGGDTSAH